MSETTVPADPRTLIDIPVRPEADAFPMLTGEAFEDLVAGIREHGQLEPIELDTDGAIGDGRNRYAACIWLGIEPRTITLPAETHWFARVVERNLNRRHATIGARAVGLVKASKVSQIVSQGNNLRHAARVAGISPASMSRAWFLLDHAIDLVPQVEAGASLRAAYDHAIERERERTEAERSEVDEEAQRIERLEALERERTRLIESVRQQHEAVGDPVVVPPEPNLALRIEKPVDIEHLVVPSTDLDVAAMRVQEKRHGEMSKAKAALAAIKAAPIDPTSPLFEGFVMATRSWASQVVALTYEIVEHYNTVLDDTAQLRRVK